MRHSLPPALSDLPVLACVCTCQSERSLSVCGSELSPPDAVRVARAAVQAGPLSRARSQLLRWILDSMDGSKQQVMIATVYAIQKCQDQLVPMLAIGGTLLLRLLKTLM